MCICLLFLTSVWFPLHQLFFLWFSRLGTRLCLGMPGSGSSLMSQPHCICAFIHQWWCNMMFAIHSSINFRAALWFVFHISCYNLSRWRSYYHCTVQLTPRTVRITLSLLIPNTERKFKGRVHVSELHWKSRWCIVITYSKSCMKAYKVFLEVQ